MILCFAITTCSLALALGMRSQQRGTRTAWFAAAGAMAGLGVVTKGPYGLLFPLIFVVLGPLRRPEWRRPRAGWLIFGAALLLAASVWAVPAYLRDGGKFLHEVVFQPDLDITERPSAWYDLIAPAIFLSLPVGLFVPMAVADWRKYGFPAALACAAAILLVVQAVPKKRQHYLLPMYPFLAVGLAASISRHASESKRIRRAASAAVLMGMAVTPFYFGVAMKWTEYAEDANLQTARHILDLLQPHKPVYVLNNLAEPMAWVGLDHRRLVELDIQEPENAAQLHDAPAGSYLVVNANRRDRLQSIAGPLRFLTVGVIEWPQSRLDELLEFPNRPPRKVMVLRLANCSTNIPAS
jgi:hypothetical protein